jgi:hypothetical protein
VHDRECFGVGNRRRSDVRPDHVPIVLACCGPVAGGRR